MTVKPNLTKNQALTRMSAAEVRGVIGQKKYNYIKALDPHPMFVALKVAHEGKSFGKILGRAKAENRSEKIWPKQRIHDLVRKINAALEKPGEKGVPVYIFHNRDNSPRRPVGRIVAATARYVKDKVHALAIAYISDQGARNSIERRDLDTCSIEAELEFARTAPEKNRQSPGAWIVNAVRNITGIALGSTAMQAPGFEHAGLMAAVQEFEIETDETSAEKEEQDMRTKLENREEKIRRLEREISRMKKTETEKEKTIKIENSANAFLEGAGVSGPERDFLMDEIKDSAPEMDADDADLQALVQSKLEKKLARLERIRSYYSSTTRIPAPPEKAASRGHAPDNPLIPRNINGSL